MFESLQNLSKQSTSKIGMTTECNLCSGQRKPKLCVVWTTYPVVTLSVTWKTHFCIKIYFNYVQTLVWLNLYAAQKPNVHTKLEKKLCTPDKYTALAFFHYTKCQRSLFISSRTHEGVMFMQLSLIPNPLRIQRTIIFYDSKYNGTGVTFT